MHRAAAAGIAGCGLTIASTFASSLGLSMHEQRVGFVIGIVLMLMGGGAYLRLRRGGGTPVPSGDPKPSRSQKNKTVQKNEGGDNISINQGDNSTALVKPTIHISAPQPGLRVESEYENQPVGGKFKSRLHLWVKDGYAANGLRVEVTGKSISDELMVMPFDPSRPGILTGGFQSPVRETTPTHALFQFSGQLRPEYVVEIQTDEPESPTVEVRLL